MLWLTEAGSFQRVLPILNSVSNLLMISAYGNNCKPICMDQFWDLPTAALSRWVHLQNNNKEKMKPASLIIVNSSMNAVIYFA